LNCIFFRVKDNKNFSCNFYRSFLFHVFARQSENPFHKQSCTCSLQLQKILLCIFPFTTDGKFISSIHMYIV
jgi:hypothetical protein